MQKYIIFLTLIILSQFACLTTKDSAQKETSNKKEKIILFSEDAGLFSYYIETSFGKEKKLIGFLYVGQNKFIIRTSEISSKKETKSLIEVGALEGQYSCEIIESNAEPDEQQALKEYLSLFTSIYFKTKNELFEKNELTENSALNGKEQEVILKKWIPFFSLFSLRNKNEKTSLLELSKIGLINKKDDPDFFNYTEPAESMDGFEYKILKKKKIDVILNNTPLLLDDNWVRNKKTETSDETFSIMKNAVKYAELEARTESIPQLKISGIYDLIKIKLYTEKNNQIIFSSVKINEYPDKTVLSYEIINNFYNVKYVITSVFIKNNDEVKSISFIAYKKVYLMNKEYFDKLLSDIIKKLYFS